LLTYIDARLSEWALWKAGKRICAGGIKPSSAYGWIGVHGGNGDNAPPPLSYIPLDEVRCAEVDRCICALEPLLRQAVEEFYLRLGTTEQAAARCKCSRMTLHRRVTEAHNLVLGYLNDLAAGVEVRAWMETEQALGIRTMPLEKKALDRVIQSSYISGTLV